MSSQNEPRRGGACCHHPQPVEVCLHPTNSPLIEISHLAFRREDRQILSDVCLTIDKGDFVAITGPNGGGKTTLLRLILGLLKPTSGKINFFPHRPTIGYLPQKNAIDAQFPITVAEVVEMGLLGIKALSRQEKKAQVAQILEKIELSELSDRPIGKLSGGQLQRVLLGRAIISNPSLLVLDEPLSYIDKHFESHIYRLLATIAPSCTTLLVSHEMSEIATMANRHIIIDRTARQCTSATHFISECD